MKKGKILIPVLALILGVGAGYVIFKAPGTEDSKDQVESMDHQIWTCSMHPQIRQNEPGDCPICGMELIPLDANSSSNPLVLEMSEEAVHLAHIQTTFVGTNLESGTSTKISGKIEANETSSASLVSHIPGRIEKLYVSFTGEKVYKGQKIATIYSPSLITAQKELLEAYKMKELQPKLYASTVNKLKYWKITDEQIEDIISSGEVRETFHIYADYSGVVQKRRVSVGDHLMKGEVLFDVQNLNNLWVVFDVYEKDLPRIQLGNLITFKTPSIPGKKFSSNVSFVDPVIDSKTRTAKIRVEVKNGDKLLKPEMFVSGEIFGDYESEMNLTVPKTAVLWTGQRSVVYVRVPEISIPSFEFREVLLGEALGDSYQVVDGLIAGEEVVTHGAFVIDASAQLNNQASMMNRLVLGALEENFLPDFTTDTPKKFKKQLEKLIEAYLPVKDALTNSDAKAAAKEAANLVELVQQIDMSLVKGDAHNYWMEQAKTIEVSANHISDETDVKTQRDYFISLSDAIVNSTKVFGIDSREYFVQFCPMADGKNGANWLSTEDGIRNPYFGEKMMTCGEVTDRIDKDFKNKMPLTSSGNPNMEGHNH